MNLHFAYMLMLCAMNEAEGRMKACDYMGTRSEVAPFVTEIMDHPILTEPSVQIAAQALREHSQAPGSRVRNGHSTFYTA